MSADFYHSYNNYRQNFAFFDNDISRQYFRATSRHTAACATLNGTDNCTFSTSPRPHSPITRDYYFHILSRAEMSQIYYFSYQMS